MSGQGDGCLRSTCSALDRLRRVQLRASRRRRIGRTMRGGRMTESRPSRAARRPTMPVGEISQSEDWREARS